MKNLLLAVFAVAFCFSMIEADGRMTRNAVLKGKPGASLGALDVAEEKVVKSAQNVTKVRHHGKCLENHNKRAAVLTEAACGGNLNPKVHKAVQAYSNHVAKAITQFNALVADITKAAEMLAACTTKAEATTGSNVTTAEGLNNEISGTIDDAKVRLSNAANATDNEIMD